CVAAIPSRNFLIQRWANLPAALSISLPPLFHWPIEVVRENFVLMIRRSLPAVFALLFATPSLAAPAGQQTLFTFVRPADVVQVAPQDASLPQSNAEQTAEGEVLRRVTFNPVAQPTLRLTPQTGAWDWSQSAMMSLRIQSAMNWAVTLYVKIQSNDGKTLISRVDLPAGPAQTLLVPL